MATSTPDTLIAATLALGISGDDENTRRQHADRILESYRYLLAQMREFDAKETSEGIDEYIKSLGT